MISTSYPGVYVQEIPSGVRTIAGVGTSVAMFLGRTQTGELNRPTHCLSYEDFIRAFGNGYTTSDLDRQVKLFFLNGGTQCYVMRLAKGASEAGVTLKNEAKANTLVAKAKSAGSFGDDIRLGVSYNTTAPESTFNLEVFRWTKTSRGTLQKSLLENYQGLSMDPAHPRYAVDVVGTASALIKLTDSNVGPSSAGYSQSGYAISASTEALARAQCASLVGTASTTNRFRISVDGNASVEVDLSSLDFTVAPLDSATNFFTNFCTAVAALINSKLPAGCTVSVNLAVGPEGSAGKDNEHTKYLTILSSNGDVRIEPALEKDLTAKLLFGVANGGTEVSRYAAARPAPTGYVMTVAELAAFAAMDQSSFNKLSIDGVEIDLSTAPFKLATSSIAGALVYQDASATNYNDGRKGLREKLNIIAAAINAQQSANSAFGYTAELWGNRLAILPTTGTDNVQPKVIRLNGAAPVTPALKDVANVNVRYYMLRSGGAGAFQILGAGGSEGTAPTASDYEEAYRVIDREVDLFNLLLLPKDSDVADSERIKLWGPASVFCQKRRAFLIMDPPKTWTDASKATSLNVGVNTLRVGLVKDHAAVYYPNLKISENGKDVFVGPCGAIAGLMARIDATRGVWKAPAGTEADLRGVTGVEFKFSDGENGVLNPAAINTLRVFPNGLVAWGARTMDGDDSFGSEYKYVPIRRLALFMEESLYRGLKWAVFEPNDEPLWAQIRLNVGAFMHNLFRQGAFQGATPREAYFVKCDSSTTTQNDRNLGIVNVVVGFAPLKPAEFVVLTIQQMAGQIQV